MKTKYNRNIRVLAENNGVKDGFNIYLDFSGQREYLMSHRHNGLLFRLLKDGTAVDDIRRWSPPQSGCIRTHRRSNTRICRMVSHLVAVIDDYMIEREVC